MFSVSINPFRQVSRTYFHSHTVQNTYVRVYYPFRQVYTHKHIMTVTWTHVHIILNTYNYAYYPFRQVYMHSHIMTTLYHHVCTQQDKLYAHITTYILITYEYTYYPFRQVYMHTHIISIVYIIIFCNVTTNRINAQSVYYR